MPSYTIFIFFSEFQSYWKCSYEYELTLYLEVLLWPCIPEDLIIFKFQMKSFGIMYFAFMIVGFHLL